MNDPKKCVELKNNMLRGVTQAEENKINPMFPLIGESQFLIVQYVQLGGVSMDGVQETKGAVRQEENRGILGGGGEDKRTHFI